MTIPLRRIGLGPGVDAWFTGRPDDEPAPAVGAAGNLSHRRPHLPSRLARDRADVLARIGLGPHHLVWMDQVHGATVTDADEARPAAQLPATDAIVTRVPGRALVVQTADCVPVLLRAPAETGAAHVGRRGLVAGIVPAVVAAMRQRSSGPLAAVIGPAIGGCCYEVPEGMRAEVAERVAGTAATTSWGTPSIDLRSGIRTQLDALDVAIGAEIDECTHHDEGWFSHRRDPHAGRQLSLIVRVAP